MIKAVLFDFGGVLSETGKQGFISSIVSDLYGVTPEELDISARHAALRRGRDMDDVLFDELNRTFGKHITKEEFVARTHAALKPSPEVYALAASLRGHGIRTGIFSNVFAMNADDLRQQGLYEDFDPVLLSYETGFAKPDRKFYELAVQKLQIQPQEILLIDDQSKCLEPAKSMGMQTIQAESPKQIVADTRALLAKTNNIAL